ncbi:hypothetical protein BBW68_01220 [Candidatus Erwinia dacicola]|uniref:Uncharacterized protein n=1 Tax=Candidatus Erwinia dacicola TaxID=252393 RepID=A0A1E7Z2Y6_9GAMM|nr:hypothetical protein BBW68_01220 [Candidatus Erwinia dacicola]
MPLGADLRGSVGYTFAEATYTQSLPDWLLSHVSMLEFIGGILEILVPNNLKSGINKACRYDPELNPSYQQLAEYYQVAVIPARPENLETSRRWKFASRSLNAGSSPGYGIRSSSCWQS